MRHTSTSNFKAEAPKIQTRVNIQQANGDIDCFTAAIVVEQFQNQNDKTVNDIRKKTNLGFGLVGFKVLSSRAANLDVTLR